MKNSFFNRFAPKEPKFFSLLKQLSDTLADASNLLVECVAQDSSEKRAAYYKRIKSVERKGDEQTNFIFSQLSTTFITPFDREDIHDLAAAIDDVIDGINSSAKRITIYNPHPISESGLELARMVQRGSQYISQAMSGLDKFRKDPSSFFECCSGLHDLENKADDVYELFIKKLFEEEKDCIEIIKIKEIMHEMERTTDAAEQVGKILMSMLVKYA